jgi:hypothetical protein
MERGDREHVAIANAVVSGQDAARIEDALQRAFHIEHRQKPPSVALRNVILTLYISTL